MTDLKSISTATETELLVAFFDLTRFARWAQSRPSHEVFETMDAYFELVGDLVEEGGGIVVKFIGDAGLLAYPADQVDAGVQSLGQVSRMLSNGIGDGSPRAVQAAQVSMRLCG